MSLTSALTSFMLPVYDLESEKVKVGDVYKFTFQVKNKGFGLTEEVLTWLIDSQDKFDVESSKYNENDELEIICRVVKNTPFLIVFGIVVVGSGALMLIFGLTLTKVEKVMEITGVQALSIAGAFILIKLFFFS